jgi:hypothetical protein
MLMSIGMYYDIFQENSQPIDTRTVFELTYEHTKARNLTIDTTVSFLGGLLERTGLGKADISAIYTNASSFTVGLPKVVAIAARESQLNRYHINKIVNKSSSVTQKILDNQNQQGYLIGNVLVVKEVSLIGETNRGKKVNLDVTALTDLFTKLFPKDRETEDNPSVDNQGKELFSVKGKIEGSVKDNTTLTVKFPEGLIVGVMANYFRIVNDKVTFEVDQLTRDQLIAEYKNFLIDSESLSPVPLA